MSILTKYFPHGKTKALTMSYDDGSKYDRRLIEIFNKYKIRGTFHINSGCLSDDWHIKYEEMPELYRGHEVSAHSKTHPNLQQKTTAGIIEEILDDRRKLEGIMGYPVRGMSYPFGIYDERVL